MGRWVTRQRPASEGGVGWQTTKVVSLELEGGSFGKAGERAGERAGEKAGGSLELAGSQGAGAVEVGK